MRRRRPGWKSGGGCGGRPLAEADRDELGRAPLSVRQREVVEAIRDHIEANGWPPTCRELATRFRWSGPSAAKQVLGVIEAKGWIEVGKRMSRAIRIMGE